MFGIDLVTLVRTIGYAGLFVLIFGETGLLVGFFLPGDSPLFTAGLLASQGILNIWALVPLCFVAAIAGDAAGYAWGHRVGRRLYGRRESRLFHHKDLRQAEAFFARQGGKAVVLARFIPIIRTFTPIVAGMGAMPYRRFATFNILGALLRAVGITLVGFFLGHAIHGADRYLLPIALAIVAASLAPGALRLWRERRAQAVSAG